MKRNIKISSLYIIIAGVFTLISLFIFLTVPNTIISLVNEGEINRYFWDFIMHVNFSKDLSNVYYTSAHACFPPLIYLFYHAISLMLPTQVSFDAFQDYRFFGVIFVILEFVMFHYMCKKMMNKEKDYVVLAIAMLVTLSSNFINGVIQSANIAFFVMLLLMLAVCLRESNSRLKQELAMILIAIAAAIKIYPAIFGLLYLQERKTKQALRLIIYGLFFFFAPFIVTGGVSGLEQFFNNITTIQSTWGELSPNGVYNNLVLLGASENVALTCDVIFGVLCCVALLLVNERWKKYFLLCAMIVMLPLWSGPYTTSFFLIPFYMLINDGIRVDNVTKLIYSVLFSIMFTSFCFSLEAVSLKCFFACITILLVIIVEEINNKVCSKKLKINNE